MRVLVVGGGAREHALVWKLMLGSENHQVYCAPGNAGTAAIAYNVPIPSANWHGLADWAMSNQIDLTIVGPERPLIEGIVDVFQLAGQRIFGPSARAAAIEGSKAWAKQLLIKYGIPTASAIILDDVFQAETALDRCTYPVAIKADGDAAGKGVVIAQDRETARQVLKAFMVDRTVGAAGERVLLEEYLEGVELSVLAFTDGHTIAPMVPACDYKRVGNGDTGPNTGGMGAYTRPSFATPDLMERIQKTILEPTVAALEAEHCPFRGVLYAGLMITADGPKVLEFNCRLGDPEAQVVLPLLKTDLLDVVTAVIEGRLSRQPIEWDDATCCGVVLASQGYPGDYPTGLPITGLEAVEDGVRVFHAGTRMGPDPRRKDPLAKLKKELLMAPPPNNTVLTAGGRVLTVAGCAPNLAEARDKVYRNVGHIRFEGIQYRTDIALRELSAISLG